MKFSAFLVVALLVGCAADSRRSRRSDASGGDGAQSVATDVAELMLSTHNEIRAVEGVGALEWSDALAETADRWAEFLMSEKNCALEHGQVPGAGPYGQNLFAGTGPVAAPDLVARAWASELADYDYSTNSCAEGKACGHYTQVMWAESKKIGCASRACEVWHVWVCNYDPPGNYVGVKPY